MIDDVEGMDDMFASELLASEELQEGAKEPGLEGLSRQMDRIEGALEGLCAVVARNSDVERVYGERRREFVELLRKLTDLSCDVARISAVSAATATRSDVDSVLQMARDEFGWLRECHAWLRGAVSVLPSARRASGVVALCILWVLAAVAAFGVGAMMLGVVTVSVGWRADGSAETAAAVRPAPAVVDVLPMNPGGEADPGRSRGSPEEYLGRREDRIGLHRDVLMAPAPQ